jgi:hypothetical protein
MRSRLLATAVALFVTPALVFSAAPAANAGTPSIRGTKEYQALKAYVSDLNAEKSQQQTPAQIGKYRRELSKKRAKASAKVRVLYQGRLSNAKQRRDNRKARVGVLKQRRNQQVAQLRAARQARLNAIAADRRAAIARINSSYASKQQNLNKQLTKARKKLAKATNPVIRANLREEISAIQDQLDTLAQEKRDDLTVANNKYDDQAQNARESYSQKIENATERANANIQNLQTRLRELYQQAKQNARQRRGNEFALVKSKYDEGVGYINKMPVSGGDNNGQ